MEWGPDARKLLESGAPCRVRIPPQFDDDEYDAIFRTLYTYRNYVLLNDEVSETTSVRGTRDFRRLLKLGRELGIGVQNGSQRPADLPRDCTAQAEWIIMFRLPLEDDRIRLAKTGLGELALKPLKEHHYLLYRQGWDVPILYPPWPGRPIPA